MLIRCVNSSSDKSFSSMYCTVAGVLDNRRLACYPLHLIPCCISSGIFVIVSAITSFCLSSEVPSMASVTACAYIHFIPLVAHQR